MEKNKKLEFIEKLTQEITDGYVNKTKHEHEIRIIPDHRKIIYQMVKTILTSKQNTVTVIPVMMGMGKSTLLEEILRYLSNKFGEFGAVIAKERNEDSDKLQKNLSNEFNEDLVYSMKGYDKSDCLMGYNQYDSENCKLCKKSVCRVKSNLEQQQYSPILSISHKRLFFGSEQEDYLKLLSKWRDFSNTYYNRKLLIIDERPVFYEIISLDKTLLDHFVFALEELTKNKIIISTAKEIASSIKALLKNKTNEYIRPTISFDEDILQKIKKTWKKYKGEHTSLCNTILCFLKNGGLKFYDAKKKNIFINVINPYNYQFEDFITIILDGTASDDLSYKSNMRMIDFPDIRKYDNLKIHWCKETNLSKTKLTHDKKAIYDLRDEICSIAKSGKTLVVTHQKHENEIAEILSDIPNTMFEHFGNLKGKNDFQECTNMVFCGTFFKPPIEYLMKAIFIDKDKISDFGSTKKVAGKKFEFPDEFVNRVMRNDRQVQLLQDIFRIKIRNFNNEDNINVYLFETDENVVQYVGKRLNGCQVEEWKPIINISTSEKFINTLNYILTDLKEKVSLKEHREEYMELGKTQYYKYSNNAEIINELRDKYGIIRVKNYFIRK